METLNRIAVTISAKQKLVDWSNQLPDTLVKFTHETINEDKTTFLIPAFDMLENAYEWFEERKPLILAEAFESICTDEDFWPADPCDDVFDDYLTAAFSTMIWDLVEDEPIEKEAL